MTGRDGSFDYIVNMALWSFLPGIMTQFILGQYHSFVYGHVSLRPKKGTAVYARDYKRVYSLVVISYFLYSIINFFYMLNPSYYSTIGVHREDIDAKLKTHFRQQMIHLHPDKATGVDTDTFMKLKNIYEVLSNESTRISYDCYGQNVLETVNRSSSKSMSRSRVGDYFNQSFYEWIAFYVITALFFLISSTKSSETRLFWRGISLVSFSSIDIYVLMRPSIFGISKIEDRISFLYLSYLHRLWNGLPTYTKISLLRKIYTTGGMAYGQIMSLHEKPPVLKALEDGIKNLDGITKDVLQKEVAYNLTTTIEPLKENEEMYNLLKNKMARAAAELRINEMMDASDRKKMASVNKNE